MSAFRNLMAGSLLVLIPAAFAIAADGITLTHYEPLQRLETKQALEAGLSNVMRAADADQRVSLRFDALGRSFDLDLQTNRRLLASLPQSEIPAGVRAYRGRLADNDASWARIVMANGQPSGLIWDGAELYAVEAPGDSIVDTDTPIIYRVADAVIEPGSMQCGVHGIAGNAAMAYATIVDEARYDIAQAEGAVLEIEIGAVADAPFTSARGGVSGAESALLARLNSVDGIYSEQLGVQITVSQIDAFEAATDPFSATTNSSDLLDELGVWRSSTPAQTALGLTHLYSGRDFDGTTVGVAFVGTLCSAFGGAGLSEGNRGVTVDSLIAAHEIGHNFSAPHDAQAGTACESTPGIYIMAPSVGPSNNTFSQCSIDQMSDDILRAQSRNGSRPACIFPLPEIDMRLAVDDNTPTALLGNTATIALEVTQQGTLEATGVEVQVTIPDEVSLMSSASSIGGCTDGAGLVDCVLGNVAGTTTETVTLTVMTDTVGTAVFNATVTADDDANPGNNQRSVALTIDPAVDLVLGVSGSPQIRINESTTVDLTLDNDSAIDATGVEVAFTLDSGLRADSATWTAGSCTISGATIDCDATGLAPGAGSSLALRVTATATGRQDIAVTATASEADRDPASNSVSTAVTVQSQSGGSDDGGSGTTGPLMLALLGLIALLRRRSAS